MKTITSLQTKLVLLSFLSAGLLAFPANSNAVPVSFGSNSLIIPMDTSANGQNLGMLRAYGLAYQLLSAGVPVNWVINPAKTANGDDFAVNLSNALQDVRTGAIISFRSYRGGPFVISPANAGVALPIIQAWQATVGDSTAVHRFIGPGFFTAEVSRALVSAPHIGVLKDGNESIAFSNLNAAGIPDSVGAAWSSASPDLLTEAGVAGPSVINHSDGVLFFSAGGLTRYGYLASMHYISTAMTPEVVQEFRASLAATSLGHAFMQCEAIRAFDNDAGGHFLTTLGLADDGPATANPAQRVPSNPLAQIDGTFQVDSGALDSIGLAAGSSFRPGVTTLINDTASSLLQRIVLLSGRLDGIASNGRVTYLAGHDYSLGLPITSNPQTNGVRLFLDSIFESGCASVQVQPSVTLTESAPTLINGNEITYTISYSNPGPRPVENVRLTDKIPAGTAYVAGSGAPAPTSIIGGVLTWNLAPLASGASGSVTYKVSVSTDGSYPNSAQLSAAQLAVRVVTSATINTVRDTVPPSVAIVAGPTGATSNPSPTFQFTTDFSAVTKTCGIDNANFVPCGPAPANFTSPTLTDGPHTFDVRVTDAAGNTGSASRSFIVDTQPPVVSIPVPPNLTTTTDSTPEFTFSDIGPAGSPVAFQCHVDGDSDVPCTSPFTVPMALANGIHTLVVTATDAAGNTGQSSLTFTVDAPNVSLVSIDVTPINPSVPVGHSVQFTAVGTFSDGTSQDLTALATWSSSNPTVAAVSNAPGSQGLATGIMGGDTQITATFAGELGSTTLTVTAPVTTGGNGAFVIGDLDAVVGRKVYFWGAHWAKNNHLSQGGAPSAFKGFANSIGNPDPTCGDTWTSDPGNSSQPPVSLPSAITVIASSSVTKSGSVITGNNKMIVVVQPDPGYGANPGHDGTGTVLSVTCP